MERRRRQIDETYAAAGESFAIAIVEGGYTEAWAWDLLQLLGDPYERWMIKKWITRYKALNRPRLRWRAESSRRLATRRTRDEGKIKFLRDKAKGP